jgi:hypothetical protein
MGYTVQPPPYSLHANNHYVLENPVKHAPVDNVVEVPLTNQAEDQHGAVAGEVQQTAYDKGIYANTTDDPYHTLSSVNGIAMSGLFPDDSQFGQGDEGKADTSHYDSPRNLKDQMSHYDSPRCLKESAVGSAFQFPNGAPGKTRKPNAAPRVISEDNNAFSNDEVDVRSNGVVSFINNCDAKDANPYSSLDEVVRETSDVANETVNVSEC